METRRWRGSCRCGWGLVRILKHFVGVVVPVNKKVNINCRYVTGRDVHLMKGWCFMRPSPPDLHTLTLYIKDVAVAASALDVRREVEYHAMWTVSCECVWVCSCAELDGAVFGRWDDMWLCLSRAETQSDIISPAPGQLMWYLLSPWPPNPVSSGRSHLQC